jgi:hypothetical protein
MPWGFLMAADAGVANAVAPISRMERIEAAGLLIVISTLW